MVQLDQTEHKYLHTFCINPDINLEIQDDGETVVLILRQSPLLQLPWVLNTFFFILLLIGLNFFLPLVFRGNQIFFIDFFALAIIFSYFWVNFLLFFFNLGVITDKRIVDVDFQGLLYREVSAARIDKIEDITSKTSGYFGSLFNYGNVFVQTAGSDENIEFIGISDPQGAAKIINDVLVQYGSH